MGPHGRTTDEGVDRPGVPVHSAFVPTKVGRRPRAASGGKSLPTSMGRPHLEVEEEREGAPRCVKRPERCISMMP